MEERTDFFNRYGSMDMLNIALEGGVSDADDHRIQISTVD